jgi:hypothetical protein
MKKEASTQQPETTALRVGGVVPSFCAVGEKIIYIERTPCGDTYEWIAEVVAVTSAYIETKHRRNSETHSQWNGYIRAYAETYEKHYGVDNLRRVEAK